MCRRITQRVGCEPQLLVEHLELLTREGQLHGAFVQLQSVPKLVQLEVHVARAQKVVGCCRVEARCLSKRSQCAAKVALVVQGKALTSESACEYGGLLLLVDRRRA